MTTHASPLIGQPWSHDWDYAIVGHFGDPDEGPTHGVHVTIKASSEAEAEHRALVYLIHNFDDEDRHRVVATSEGVLPATDPTPTVSGEATYRVRLDFPWGGR